MADGDSIRAAFDSVDTDGSGVIDGTEFTALCMKLDATMTEDEVDDALETLDEDGDGEISFKEFSSWWQEEKGGGCGSAAQRGAVENLRGYSKFRGLIRRYGAWM